MSSIDIFFELQLNFSLVAFSLTHSLSSSQPHLYCSGNPVTSYFVKTVVIFFVSMSLLLWIFAPKIYYARNPQNSDSTNISSPYGSTGSQAGASSSMYTGPTSHELNKLGEDSNTFSRSGHDGVSPSSSNVAERVLEVETGQPTDV